MVRNHLAVVVVVITPDPIVPIEHQIVGIKRPSLDEGPALRVVEAVVNVRISPVRLSVPAVNEKR
jgi:hypothetical protein